MAALLARLDPRRSLRARIGLSFAFTAFVFALAGGLYEGRQQEVAMREATGLLFQHLATSFANELRSDLRERFDDLRFVATEMGSGEAPLPPGARRAALRELLSTLQLRRPEL